LQSEQPQTRLPDKFRSQRSTKTGIYELTLLLQSRNKEAQKESKEKWNFINGSRYKQGTANEALR